jgi:hypothetical protein
MDINDRLETEFAANIDRFEQGKLPAFTHKQYVAANDALTALYAQSHLLAWESPGNLRLRMRDAERAWLEYRGAFAAFAILRWPSASGDSWLTYLTSQRLKQLKTLAIP